MGWATIKNGRLLALAENNFDVFLTVDRNLAFQQRMPKFKIAVLVIHARSNRLADLKPLASEILGAILKCEPGRVTRVGIR